MREKRGEVRRGEATNVSRKVNGDTSQWMLLKCAFCTQGQVLYAKKYRSVAFLPSCRHVLVAVVSSCRSVV